MHCIRNCTGENEGIGYFPGIKSPPAPLGVILRTSEAMIAKAHYFLKRISEDCLLGEAEIHENLM